MSEDPLEARRLGGVERGVASSVVVELFAQKQSHFLTEAFALNVAALDEWH